MKNYIVGLSFTVAAVFCSFAAVKASFPFIAKGFADSHFPMKTGEKGNLLDGYECSDGWRITGYFTPIEADYASEGMREVEIEGVGKKSFNAEFLDTVFNEEEGWGEGWGKTRFGWYLGNYNGAWHKSDAPLDANNSPLETNSVAVDNNLIPNGSSVKIPDLPTEYSTKTFVANDVGVTVHGKHIDVYTGEGKAAEEEMNRVTFEDENLIKVCYKKP
jgi:3D (Asp-Asp-Asp) domain-containing protein